MGALITILSVLTAYASWQYDNADGISSGYSSEGVKILIDANAEYLLTNQDINQDYAYFDTYYLNSETNPETANYYEENFSDELLANLERDTPTFDDQYYDEMYQSAEELFDEADHLFTLASQLGLRTDKLQLSILIFAIALSFTAWASLLEKNRKLRLLFTLLACIITLVGIGIYISAPSLPA